MKPALPTVTTNASSYVHASSEAEISITLKQHSDFLFEEGLEHEAINGSILFKPFTDDPVKA